MSNTISKPGTRRKSLVVWSCSRKLGPPTLWCDCRGAGAHRAIGEMRSLLGPWSDVPNKCYSQCRDCTASSQQSPELLLPDLSSSSSQRLSQALYKRTEPGCFHPALQGLQSITHLCEGRKLGSLQSRAPRRSSGHFRTGQCSATARQMRWTLGFQQPLGWQLEA